MIAIAGCGRDRDLSRRIFRPEGAIRGYFRYSRVNGLRFASMARYASAEEEWRGWARLLGFKDLFLKGRTRRSESACFSNSDLRANISSRGFSCANEESVLFAVKNKCFSFVMLSRDNLKMFLVDRAANCN